MKAIQLYVNKIITETPGIKVLLLDSETVSLIIFQKYRKTTNE